MTLPELIQDLRLNHEYCPKEIILEAATALEVLASMLNPKQERNFCPRCGKRLMSALGPVSLHTCCPPTAPTGWDNGLSQDYNKKLGAWFSEKPNAKEELRGRTFDDYGNKLP